MSSNGDHFVHLITIFFFKVGSFFETPKIGLIFLVNVVIYHLQKPAEAYRTMLSASNRTFLSNGQTYDIVSLRERNLLKMATPRVAQHIKPS